MFGIAIANWARISLVPTARTALSNASIRTIAPGVTVAVFAVFAVLVLMAALFAESVHEVTKKSWRVVAVVVLQATFRVIAWVAAIVIFVQSYSLFHDDVVTGTFSDRIADTLLLSLVKGEVGDIPTDTFLGAEQVAPSLSWCRIGVVSARIHHRAFRFVDRAAHVSGVACLAAPWALCSAPGLAEAKRVFVNLRVFWVDVALIVNVPCWLTSQVAAAYVILNGFLPRSKEVAVFIPAICLVEKKPVAGTK